MQLPNVDIRTDYFSFGGGVDLVTPETKKPPGTLFSSLNYEPANDGGYRRINGHEAFDGRARPSLQAPLALACTLTSTPAAGAMLTIGSATARFIKVIDGGILVAEVSGTIPASTSIVSGSPIGTTESSIDIPYPVTQSIEAGWLVDTADYYRSLIGAVPGSGPVRGVWMFNGVVYAFRNNSGGTACVMHRSTTGGWTAVSLGEEIRFTNVSATALDGATLTQSGKAATILRIVIETGSLASGVNTGRLIITGRTGGSFSPASANISGGATVNLAAVQAAITLPPGGRYRFKTQNFGNTPATNCMYGVNGVGRAFEFDGTAFVPLYEGTPTHLEANRNYLFLGMGPRVVFCAIGDPYVWDASVGAGDFPTGSDITAMKALTGKALGVFCRNASFGLYGSTKSDFSLDNIAPESGAVNGIVGVITDTYMLDDRGVVSLAASQSYGNFESTSVSRHIQPIINTLKRTAVDSVVIKSKNQMRIFASDGTVLAMRPIKSGYAEFLPLQYPFTPNCAACVEDETGQERLFVGASDGFVYETDVGSTFNGAAVESYMKVSYYNARSPHTRKTFRRAEFEMTSDFFTSLSMLSDYDFGDTDVQSTVSDDFSVFGAGGQWDISSWDTFYWDVANISKPKVRINGSGTNLSFTIYSNTKFDFGHTIQGATVFYTPRRLQR